MNQREVGVDVPSFAEAIRRALRQDPDVILVVKCETWKRSARPSRQQKPVTSFFGTLHTNSAQGTVNRIIDAFPETSRIRFELS